MATSDIKPNRIFLWVNPRSLSTAFEKCIAFIDGAQVWHEPYTACMYNRIGTSEEELKEMPKVKTALQNYGKVIELLANNKHRYKGGNLSPVTCFTYDWVKNQLEQPIAKGKTFLFMKDCGHTIDGYYDKLPEVPVRHTFLIRHPRRIALSMRTLLMNMFDDKGNPDDFDFNDSNVFMSWSKVAPNALFQFFKHVRDNIDPNPIVIDADDLQNHPADIMKKYCNAVGIPFNDSNLNWPASDEILKTFYGSFEQFVYGKDIGSYDTAFDCSRFLPITSEIPTELPEKCKCYEDEFMEGYKIMYEYRIKPDEVL